MQKVTALLPSWDTTKSSSKKGFDKVWGWADKLGAPVNRLTNKIGSEAFWPTTLDKESDKAARILRSFCKDGFYTQEDRPTGGPNQKPKVLKKIPAEVIQNAVGLAIFTVMRTGLWISGAGGSGVLIARQEDGSWSPPSGIMLHTAGLGFLVGVDIYDCVVVINNRKALEAFTKVRATLGGEISAVAGPVGVGGVLEHDGKWKQVNKPVFTYLKSRGFYAGVQVDGTIVIERMDENERFYGQKLAVAEILAGKVRHPPLEIKMLMETVKAAEGRNDIDQILMRELEDQPAPGDVGLDKPTRRHSQSRGPIFGLPEPDDPDPFGVLALQKAGLEIREAGTGSRPSSEAFEFKPSPASPIYGHFRRMSQDTLATRSNRESYMSNRTRASTDRATQTIEMGTQTDADYPNTPLTSPSLWNEQRNIITEEQLVKEPDDIDYTKIDLGPYGSTMTRSDSSEFQSNGTTVTDQDQDPVHGHSHDETVVIRDSDGDLDADDEEEEPVVFEVAAVQTTGPTLLRPQVIKTRGSIVDIPKRVPPPLPPRNPIRARGGSVSHSSISSLTASPITDGFEDAALNGSTRVATVHEVLAAETPDEKLDHIVMMDNEGGNDSSCFINDIQLESPQTPVAVVHADASREVTKLDAADEKPVLHVNSTGATHTREGEESDDFHSIPTTPNEQ